MIRPADRTQLKDADSVAIIERIANRIYRENSNSTIYDLAKRATADRDLSMPLEQNDHTTAKHKLRSDGDEIRLT